MTYPGNKKSAGSSYDGSKRETLDMGVNNFLIEIVFKTAVGYTKGVLVSKMTESGYQLTLSSNGGGCLTLQSGSSLISVTSTVKINDGNWHHLIAEVDRSAAKATLYVDSKLAGSGKLEAFSKDLTLSNKADFLVGKEFIGAIDFLRVCRSTLAESMTSIEELCAWEFNGPFLHDFTGKSPANGKRDAGAIGR